MLQETPAGLYCRDGDFYVDPWGSVDRALITHAHGDHARFGSTAYLCVPDCEPLLQRRFGGGATIEAIPYGEAIRIGAVRVSFHPAGHVLGSAQIRLEGPDGVWVVSGDYKRAADPTCLAFEPVACDTFVTESTFGLPIYRWDDTSIIIADILDWWEHNRRKQQTSVVFCYTLGKAQRLLAELGRVTDVPVFVHGMMLPMIEAYRERGVAMLPTLPLIEKPRGTSFAGELVLAPLSARGTPWMRRLGHISDAFVSGLMRVRGVRRQRAFDRGFVLSDHADWPAILQTISETGAGRVLTTHGHAEPLARFLQSQGLQSGVIRTAWEGEPADRMRRFATLFTTLDQTNSTNDKVEAMRDYFAAAPPADAAWAVFFLTGRRLKRLIPGVSIRDWTIAATGIEEWLLGECYSVVGDGAETAALIFDQLPIVPTTPLSLADWVDSRILPLRQATADQQRTRVLAWLRELDRWERLVLLKLLTGELRLGVSHTLAVRALAQAANLPPTTMAARLMGEWTPSAAWFASSLSPTTTEDDRSRPYPFFLASPIEERLALADVLRAGGAGRAGGAAEKIEDVIALWQFEWKWDGIRAQLVKREGRIHLWSRGEELITTRFPEIIDAASALADGTVLDGEVLAFRDDRPLPFAALQQRIGRQLQVARKARDVPAVFMAYDLLEHASSDCRALPLAARRALLEQLVTALPPVARHETSRELLLPFEESDDAGYSAIRLSPILRADSLDELSRLRARSRDHGVEGLMLKRLTSSYGVGRTRGDWWKWKIEPFTIDAVLIYAQPGSGKRASLLTDYTFGLWDNGELVPVAKAYSGLTNEEILEMDRWIRRHTVERFGPVRHVEPIHVFELGFEAIARSSRHRSGIAVRFPRMLRWRKDKPASEADTLETLRGLLRGR